MWRLVFSKRVEKQLSTMDAGIRRIIVAWLLKNVDGGDDPPVRTAKGSLATFRVPGVTA